MASELDKSIYELALSSSNGIDIEKIQESRPSDALEAIVNSVNRLLKEGKFELLQMGSKLVYRAVNSDELALMSGLSQDEQLVYKHIQNSGNEGIWVRTIKMRTNLLQGVVTRSLKSLEQKAMIKSIKSIKHPTRKLYMLIGVTPSSEVTGGPWYTDQEMDTDFIEQLSKQCYQFIYRHSYPRHNPEAVFTANYTGFPTSSQIRRFISDNNITNVDLSLENIEELLTMLVYDGKIERIAPTFEMDLGGGNKGTDWMYRALRVKSKDSPLTDIPCGRCPVFDRCSDTGDITPMKCEYYKKWLSF